MGDFVSSIIAPLNEVRARAGDNMEVTFDSGTKKHIAAQKIGPFFFHEDAPLVTLDPGTYVLTGIRKVVLKAHSTPDADGML